MAVTTIFTSGSFAAEYQLLLLGSPSSGFNSGFGINSSGTVVGGGANSPGFIFNGTQFLTLPQIIPGPVVTGPLRAITSQGLAVGQIGGGAAFWDGVTLQRPANPRGVDSSIAFAVNSSGIATGTVSTTSTRETFVVTWDTTQENAEPTVLVGLDPVTPFGGQSSFALGITDDGRVVGWSTNALSQQRPVVWTNGALSQLPLGSATSGGVRATTPDGTIMVGTITGSNGFSQASIWSNGTLSLLETPPGTFQSFALGLNAQGSIVGGVRLSNNGPSLAAVWRNGQLSDLNTLVDTTSLPSGAFLSDARAINDNGLITGSIRFANGETQAFLMTPVPEPSTVLMLAVGLLILWLRRPVVASRRS